MLPRIILNPAEVADILAIIAFDERREGRLAANAVTEAIKARLRNTPLRRRSTRRLFAHLPTT